MKRVVLIALFLILTVGLSPVFSQTPTSGPRYAAGDRCGYYPPNPPPGNWLSCKRCLYPGASDDPTSKETLRITDPESNIAPTTMPGKMYTQLGCIGTGLGGFQQEGAAAGVVQILLNTIFAIVGGLAFLSLIYGAFIIMTSQANPERLNYGKRIVYGAIVGAIFSISAVFIVNLIASGILKIPGFGGTSP